MTDKLSLYKGALRALGEVPLASLTEDRPARYTLDDIWNSGIRDLALSEGFWNFATRAVRIEYTGDIEPDFGFQRAFEKPSDWIRTAAVSLDEYFDTPLNRYADEQGYWFADADTLYIKYVSKDTDYGYNLAAWPINFVRFFEHLMASEGAERITQSRVKKSDMVQIASAMLMKAKNTDAMNQPINFAPRGSWASSRMSGRSGPGRYPGGWRR